MTTADILIIFTKNPVHGEVKTRLAASIGHDKALDIYQQLVACTYSTVKPLACNKVVYYSDNIPKQDIWNDEFTKSIQQGSDLGERMSNAFKEVFAQGYKKAVIIGTDCPSIDQQLLADAFAKLNTYDAVIGPAADGGYYLMGMKEHYELFDNIAWSTPGVLAATLKKCDDLGLSYFLLPVLNDIDEEKDLEHLKPLANE